MGRRATAQDVADLAGVSRSAVSLVLNGRGAGNISAAKQAAIFEAARQLSYTPNAVALSLRRRRTRTIGLLTWSGPAAVPVPLIDAVYVSAAAAGYLLLPANVGRASALVEVLLDRQVDGFVVVAPELIEYTPPEALGAIPAVLVNCYDPTHSAPALVTDESGAGELAARVLVEAGHVRVGVVADAEETLQSTRRVTGVLRALAAAGLPPPTVLTSGRDVAGGYHAAVRALDRPDRPTALVCTHERPATGALLAASALGLAVPADLSVVGLDDGEGLAGELVPAVTLVQRPDAAMASYAIDILLDALREGDLPARHLSFACSVVVGESVGPPPT